MLHPKGKSENDGIPKTSMTYIIIEDAIRSILTLGKGAFLAKIDVKHAFRLIPIHPVDRHTLAMEWKGGMYVNTYFSFGLRSTPKVFNISADLLA